MRATELGSFTAAAAVLGVSPQMVGKHISSLEQRFGAGLLNRSARRQSLTAVGQAFYERCRAILADVAAAEALAGGSDPAYRGRLRIGAPVAFGACCLAPLIAGFLAAYPEIDIDLRLGDHMFDVVGEGYDAVVRLGALPDSSLKSRALIPFTLAACASPAYLARRGTPTVPEDLASHDRLTFVYWSGFPHAEWVFAREDETHTVPVRSRFQVNDARVLRAAALDGLGIVLQSTFLVRDDLVSGRFVEVLPGYVTPSRPTHLLFSGEGRPPPRLRAFIDFAIEAFGPRSA